MQTVRYLENLRPDLYWKHLVDREELKGVPELS